MTNCTNVQRFSCSYLGGTHYGTRPNGLQAKQFTNSSTIILLRLFYNQIFRKRKEEWGEMQGIPYRVLGELFFAVIKFRFQFMWLRQMIITIKYRYFISNKLNRITNVISCVRYLVKSTLFAEDKWRALCYVRQMKRRKWYPKAYSFSSNDLATLNWPIFFLSRRSLSDGLWDPREPVYYWCNSFWYQK